MFDGVSLAASVVTLEGALSKSIKYARNLWHASEELKAVQVRKVDDGTCKL